MAAEQTPRGAGMGAYLKEAFLFRWNLLFFLGGTAAAALTPVRGAAGDQSSSAEEIRTPGLDRLLWLFLRLLLSKAALDRFLATIDEKEISTRLAELRKSFAAAQGGDDRIVRSLQDSIAMCEL